MQNITQTLFFKAILPWEVTNLHEKNMWPHQGCQQGPGTGGWGFLLATMSMSPGYFNKRKQKENGTKRTSIQFTAY